jgi:two-component system sensor histidine kinase HydH
MDTVDFLSRIIEISNSSVEIEERLAAMIDLIFREIGARQTLLFTLGGVTAGYELHHVRPRPTGPGAAAPVHLVRQPLLDRVRNRRQPVIVVGQNQMKAYDLTDDRLLASARAAAAFPVMDDTTVYGILVLLFDRARQPAAAKIRIMQVVCRELAGAIRNYRLYREAKKRIAELSALFELGRAASRTIDLDDLLDIIVRTCARVLNARAAMITVVDRQTDRVIQASAYGPAPATCRKLLELGRPAETAGCKTEDAVGRSDQTCPVAAAEDGEDRSLTVHTEFQGPYRGNLCVFDKIALEPDTKAVFTVEDKALLSTMASMVSSAIENAISFHKLENLAASNEEMIAALASLYETSSVVMTSMDLDKGLRIILQETVLPQGLGLDRAVIMLVDEAGRSLDAKAGAVRPAEPKRGPLSLLLKEAAERGENVPPGVRELVERLHVPLERTETILVRTITEGRSFRHQDVADDPRIKRWLDEKLTSPSFATMPMFAEGRVIGLLAVDNLTDNREITQRDLHLLSMLANLAGMVVEKARLYNSIDRVNRELTAIRERMVEAETMAALGEMAAGLAHEIRNPLVSIGGFTRRIRKKVGPDSPLTMYLDVIIQEVERLEKTLNETLDFSQDTRGHFAEHSLEDICEQALELLQREIKESDVLVEKHYQPVSQIFCDDRQIKHALFNIFLNALQAMNGEGTMDVRTYRVIQDSQEFAACTVTDSGGGIPREVFSNIFNPFFTTKDGGTGLGLSIVHKIVKRHGGDIDVANIPGQGASFTIKLPAAKEARSYLK